MKVHPSDDDLNAFVANRSDAIEFPDFEVHVEDCAFCRRRLEARASLRLDLEALIRHAAFCPGCGYVVSGSIERCESKTPRAARARPGRRRRPVRAERRASG